MRHFPTKDEILDWIRDNPKTTGKREIARAFGIKGGGRIELKRILRELEDEGHVSRRQRRIGHAGHLPPVGVLVAGEPDRDGDIFARPANWEGEADPPRILYLPRKGDPALGAGDRFLAKLHPVESEDGLTYQARLIKRLGAGQRRMLGIFRAGPQGGRVVPVDKKAGKDWLVAANATGGAHDGELVEAEAAAGPRTTLRQGRIVARLGNASEPRQVSLIAIHEHGIPYTFAQAVLDEAGAAKPVPTGHGEDLRDLPLVLFPRPAGSRMEFEHAAAAAGFPLSIAHEVQSQDVLRDFVVRGLGYGLLPYSSMRPEQAAKRIKAVAVDGLALTSPDASLPTRSVRLWGLRTDEHAAFELRLDAAPGPVFFDLVEHHLRPPELLGEMFFKRDRTLIPDASTGSDRLVQRMRVRVSQPEGSGGS